MRINLKSHETYNIAMYGSSVRFCSSFCILEKKHLRIWLPLAENDLSDHYNDAVILLV
jgi:hypothetical protein